MQADLLAPFLHPLMLHVCSALTHLADGVRSDALATLELMLDHAPRGALGRYTAQVLNPTHALSEQQLTPRTSPPS
jgi:pre-rRNA-processing protein IPI1